MRIAYLEHNAERCAGAIKMNIITEHVNKSTLGMMVCTVFPFAQRNLKCTVI